jgi:alanine racemase
MWLRPTIAEVDLSAIEFNIHSIQNRVAPAEIMAVVKANAYGHGAVKIAHTLIKNGVKCLGVASVEEGIELRDAGIDVPILVFSGLSLNQAALYIKSNLEATIFDKSGLAHLTAAAQSARKNVTVHIKIDTGMGRVGVVWQNAVEFVKLVHASKGLNVKGIYTHFANSDHLDKSFALLQLARFNNILQELVRAGIQIPIKHAANSGAILDIPESYFDLVRPGISIYGYYPSASTTESLQLKPAMQLKSHVLFLKDISKGDSISYDRTYIAPQTTRVATIPIGYADGYNRLLSNGGTVLIGGQEFPVIGRITMDLLMVDVGDNSKIKIGDNVVLLGKQGNKEISIQSICNKLDTIPYEIMCSISNRVPRTYI